MFSKPFAVGLLALACVSAAAAGSYVAVRQNQTLPAASTVGTTADGQAPARPAVQETEAVVTPAAALEVERTPAVVAPDLVERPRRVDRAQEPVKSSASNTAARSVRPESSPASNRATTAPRRSAAPPATAVEPAVPSAVAPPPASDPPSRAEAPAPAPVEPLTSEPPPPAPPAIEELVIPAAAVMGLRIDTPVSSETARIEDRVEARVTRDLSVDGRTAIAAGTRVIGAVTQVEKGGKVKDRSRLGVRFHTLVLADGTELPLRTEPILREGDSPAGESGRKIGGAAVGGAILGAIMGGKKGAIVGGATGAAGGTAVVMAGDRNAATLPIGSVVTVRLAAPLTVEVEKQ